MRTRYVLFVGLLVAAGCLDAPPTETPAPAVEPPTPWPDAGWSELAPAPTYRTENAVAAANGKLYSIGGMTNESTTITLVEVYDIAKNQWTRGPDYPVPAHHLHAASVGGTVYGFGGLSGAAAVALSFRLDTGLALWVPVAPMPQPRAAGVAVTVGEKIYVVGGYGAGLQHVADMFVFDPSANVWTTEPGPPTLRDHTGAAGLEGTIYLMAGDVGGHGRNTDAAEAYGTTTKKWSKLAPVPTVRGSNAALAFRDRILVVGGQNATGVFDDVEAYDPATDSWTILPPLSKPRHGFGSAAWEGRVFLVTGGHEPGNRPGQQTSVSLEAFGSLDAQPLT